MPLLLIAIVIVLLAGCRAPQPSEPLVTIRLQLGLNYLMRGETAAARRNLQRALKLSPQDYRVQLAMARYFQQMADSVVAQNYYHRALQLAPRNRQVLNNYGAFLCGIGQYDAGQRLFRQAAEYSANDVCYDSLENSGYCYLNAGQQVHARERLTALVLASPSKGLPMLAEAERRFGKGRYAESRLLLDVYQHNLPAAAESVWLEIRLAAQAERPDDVQRFGAQLARIFPQSIQYQHFLANEY